MKKIIILASLAFFLAASSASAQEATSTDGTYFGAPLSVTAICAAPGETEVSWDIRNSRYTALYKWHAYDYGGSAVYQTGEGKLDPEATGRITVKRGTGVAGKIQLSISSGKAVYGHLGSEFIGTENISCFPASSQTQTAPVAPATENPQVISLMQMIIDLLKQIISLKLSLN